MAKHLFTSESVSEGHPDKIADQISDAVLDAILEQDPKARVACETYVKTGMVLVGGEITTSARVDIEEITRKTVREIGYVHSDMGFDANSCAVLSAIGKQSPDINQGVDRTDPLEQGAGDQGLMFGYATNETDVLMPAPVTYAHRLVQRQSEVRKNGTLPWLRPDAKSRVTFQYDDGKIVGIDAVVLSTQHSEEIALKDLQEAVMEEIIKPVLPAEWLTAGTKYHINPTGRFVIGGPMGDCGLTGRKIIVDTYGGMARHGGGAFSGKDPSKVDRSAAYAARYVAKNIVAAGTADRCEIGVLRYRRSGTDLHHGGNLRYRESADRTADAAGARILRSAPIRPDPDDGSAAADLPRNRCLRPLRPRALPWEATDKAALLRDAAGLK